MTELSTASAVSRYRFIRRLAVGGMAEIYVADAAGAAGVTRRVALKRVLPHLAPDDVFIRMFLNEARLASTLQHPNIIQTYDVIDDGGTYLIVMELLDGMNLVQLRKQLRKLGRHFTAQQALYIVDRILAGLHHAHERRTVDGRELEIVHRDVSPHNVFLTVDGVVKLLDFGVAKAEAILDKRGTESGVVKGKVLYMSPEQCQGQEVDRRTDIWAAGVLLYVLLTGRAPFKGKNTYDTMRAVIHDYPVAPSTHTPGLSVELDAVVLQALAKNPENRFQTARDMQLAISDVVRRGNLYMTDVEFTAFVEEVFNSWDAPPPDTDGLPSDIVISEGGTEQLARYGKQAENTPGPIAETEHALVDLLGGLTVLTLRGTIDERFDPSAIIPHLEGTVLIDTEAVQRITSYGIRGLLELFDKSRGRIEPFHIHCSVAFVQQFGMIRALLGGGRVVSFQMPYVDPENGNPFVDTVSGKTGEEILRTRRAPHRSCPGFPGRAAQFDEDAHSYLCFGDDYIAEPPRRIAGALAELLLDRQHRQVEKAVSASGTDLWIRRPLETSYRWRRVLAGLEGRVRIDMKATPSWTQEGVRAVVNTLAREAHTITSLEIRHMPSPIVAALQRNPPLRELLTSTSTVRVHARCDRCDAPRRVAVAMSDVDKVQRGAAVEPDCPSCGGPLIATESLVALVAGSIPPPPERRRASPQVTSAAVRSPWMGLLVALLLFGLVLVFVLVVLVGTLVL